MKGPIILGEVKLLQKIQCCIKGPFRDPQPHPPFTQKKIRFTTSRSFQAHTVCVEIISC